jgi:hypothetical protein
MSLKLLPLLVLGLLFASPGMAVENGQQTKAGKKSPDARIRKEEDERIKRGKRLLSQAEASALEAEMRAYALLQTARAYAAFNLVKACDLLDQAYTASQTNQQDTPSKTRLVQQILVAMAQTIPDRAEELLPYVPAEIRGDVLNTLLRHYLKKKAFEPAKDMVLHLAREGDFPYDAAAQLMASLPKDNSMDRQAVFGAALTAFKASSGSGRMTFGGDVSDLGDLVVRFWRDLPASLTKEAIDTLLDAAEDPDVPSLQPRRIITINARKTSNFNSLFEYRAQQLLPILRKVDESEGKQLAEKLKKLNPTLNTNDELPVPSTDSESGEKQETSAHTQFAGLHIGRPRNASAVSTKFMQIQRVLAIQDLAVSKPQDALTQASSLEPEPRAMALEGIARVTAKNDSRIARKALDELMGVAKNVELEAQERHLAAAARIYLRLDDKPAAQRAIERGVETAAQIYKYESSGEDANDALKAYWSSSTAWRRLIRLAVRISEDFAVSIVNEIPDPEIKATQRLALAGDLLGLPSDSNITIVWQKEKPTQTWTGFDEDEAASDEVVSER